MLGLFFTEDETEKQQKIRKIFIELGKHSTLIVPPTPLYVHFLCTPLSLSQLIIPICELWTKAGKGKVHTVPQFFVSRILYLQKNVGREYECRFEYIAGLQG